MGPWANSIPLLDPDKTSGWSPALGGHGIPGGSCSPALGNALDVLLFKPRENRGLKLVLNKDTCEFPHGWAL